MTGADIAQNQGGGSVVVIALGVATATFGGIIHDILGGDIPVILRREIYVTASFLGASVFVLLLHFDLPKNPALVAGFLAAFLLRGAAVTFNLSLPVFARSIENGKE